MWKLFQKSKKLFLLVFALLVFSFSGFGTLQAPPAVSASAYSTAGYQVDSYRVQAQVNKDRTVQFVEYIELTVLRNGFSTFYRSLPLEGDGYTDLYAKCEGNADFSYSIADNPDVSGFLDINCTGGTQKGAHWTYELGYTMEIAGDDIENGMILDVIGFGWYVPLNDVSVQVFFPAPLKAHKLYSGGYGASGNDANVQESYDTQTNCLLLKAERLDLTYNGHYEERMAEGITLEFSLGEGVFTPYLFTRVFTLRLAVLLPVFALAIVGVWLLVRFFKKKRELIVSVNIKPPDGLDPLQTGKLLDGVADGEDITSMIYYFADQGYLSIDLSDQDDPVLIKRRELPTTAPVHQKTLFKGLFLNGDNASVSSLKYKFYTYADSAKTQVGARVMPRYEKRSLVGTVVCLLLGVLFAFFCPFVAGLIKIGHGYTYWKGIFIAIPAVAVFLLELWRKSYRYKWKKGKTRAVLIVEIVIVAIATLILVNLVAEHIFTGLEIALICIVCCLCAFVAPTILSWTEKYCDTLGNILGFKDFIVYTEEDKIKFMLEENPELYYHILPYAQVLGVSDEWEKKFAKLLLEPPSWCVSTHMTVFDYIILNRCMRMATLSMMMRPQKTPTVGRSGGGGSFGGFGGGGRGGGGGGMR